MKASTYFKIMNSSFECDFCEEETPPEERVILNASDKHPEGTMWICVTCDVLGPPRQSPHSLPEEEDSSCTPF